MTRAGEEDLVMQQIASALAMASTARVTALLPPGCRDYASLCLLLRRFYAQRRWRNCLVACPNDEVALAIAEGMCVEVGWGRYRPVVLLHHDKEMNAPSLNITTYDRLATQSGFTFDALWAIDADVLDGCTRTRQAPDGDGRLVYWPDLLNPRLLALYDDPGATSPSPNPIDNTPFEGITCGERIFWCDGGYVAPVLPLPVTQEQPDTISLNDEALFGSKITIVGISPLITHSLRVDDGPHAMPCHLLPNHPSTYRLTTMATGVTPLEYKQCLTKIVGPPIRLDVQTPAFLAAIPPCKRSKEEETEYRRMMRARLIAQRI